MKGVNYISSILKLYYWLNHYIPLLLLNLTPASVAFIDHVFRIIVNKSILDQTLVREPGSSEQDTWFFVMIFIFKNWFSFLFFMFISLILSTVKMTTGLELSHDPFVSQSEFSSGEFSVSIVLRVSSKIRLLFWDTSLHWLLAASESLKNTILSVDTSGRNRSYHVNGWFSISSDWCFQRRLS